MATLLPKKMAQFVATASEATYYTVPAGKQGLVKNIVIANTSALAATVSISLVPSGGVAGNANRIAPGLTVPGNTAVQYALTQVMNAGDFLSAIASAAATFTVTVSGMEG